MYVKVRVEEVEQVWGSLYLKSKLKKCQHFEHIWGRGKGWGLA